MSHVAKMQIEVKSLAALKDACKALGWDFREAQTTYRWFGTWVGDTPFTPDMFDSEEEHAHVLSLGNKSMPYSQAQKDYMTEKMGRCEHAIRVPGADYEIGVVGNGKGGLRLLWDYFDGKLVKAVGGQTAPKLAQAYSTAVVKRFAKSKGMAVIERPGANGSVKLQLVAR